jgi:hypothetical protein
MKTMYALVTSKDLHLTKRAVDSFGKAPVHIFVNTLDTDFRKQVDCDPDLKKHIVVHTPSTGTAGVGKQSMVKYFLYSDYTHLIQIDGDDMLYPGATDFITDYFTQKDTNVLALVNEDCMGKTFFTKWSDLSQEILHRESGEPLSESGMKFYRLCMDLISEKYPQNFFHRILMFDKKAASMMQYNPVIRGPDDVRLFCDLKLAYSKNLLKISLVERPGTYLYDKRNIEGAGIRMNDEQAAQIVLKEFHKGLTDQDLEVLRNTRIPVETLPDPDNLETRKQYVNMIDQKYDINYV